MKIDPQAIVEHGAVLGEDCIVWQFAHVMPGALLEAHVSVGGATEIGRYVMIGEGTRIGYGCFIPNKTKIGRRVFIGPRVVMCDDRYPSVTNPHYKAEPPVVEDFVSIGAGVVILPGVRLGLGCRVGAGSVVTRDVPPHATVVGNPARVLRKTPAVKDVDAAAGLSGAKENI